MVEEKINYKVNSIVISIFLMTSGMLFIIPTSPIVPEVEAGSFTFDTQPPSSIINNPENNSYHYTLNEINGIASDGSNGSGINKVHVSIERLSDNYFWNGSGWNSNQHWLVASGTSSWYFNTGTVVWDSGVQYRVRSKAVDNASNVEQSGPGKYFIIDRDKPTSKIVCPTKGIYNDGFNLIYGTANDAGGSGIDSVEICIEAWFNYDPYWDGNRWVETIYPIWLPTTGTSNWSYDSSSVEWYQGSYIIYARAVDKVNNTQQTYSTVSFCVDNINPYIGLYQTWHDNIWLKGVHEINGWATDGEGGSGLSEIGVQLSLGQNNWNYYPDVPYYWEEDWSVNTSNIDWPSNTTSKVIIKCYAIDRANNTATCDGQFLYDTEPPVSNIIYPSNNSVLRDLDSITASAYDSGAGLFDLKISIMRKSDNKYLDGYLGGTTWYPYEVWFWPSTWIGSNFTYDSSNINWIADTYIVRSKSSDLAYKYKDALQYELDSNVEVPGTGNIFTIESNNNITPQPELVTPEDNSWLTNNKPKFEWDIQYSDSIYQTHFQVLIDDDQYFTSVNYDSGLQSSSDHYWQFPGGTSYSTIADGTWYWKVQLKDNRSKLGPFSETGKFMIDTTAPVSSINVPINDGTYTSMGNIKGSAFDPSGGSGIKKVELVLERLSDNLYWSGSDWSSTKIWLPASGTSSWSYDSSGIIWTSETQYLVRSRGTDNLNNIEVPGSGSRFTMDLSKVFASSDIPIKNNGITGDYTDTHTSNDVYESIKEKREGKYSRMEHKWTIPVTSGFGSYVFYLEAFHSVNSEGDDFVFSYSTNDVAYTDIVTVTKTSDNDAYQAFNLPELSGTVYIKVKDTDRTVNKKVQDTIYIDHMFIKVSGEPEPNRAPDQPTNPGPSDSATNVDVNPTLSVYVSDPNGDSMDVTFYDAIDDSVIGTDYDVSSGSTASITWSGLDYDITYNWYAVSDDSEYTNTSDTWSFTTKIESQPGVMYVWDISWKKTGPHLKAIVNVRVDSDNDGIAESTDELVSGAMVYFTLTHDTDSDGVFEPGTDDNSKSYTGTTDSMGNVEFKWRKAPKGDYQGFVTNITHNTYTYNPDMNVDNTDYYTL
jgi:hypothetical protein